MAIWGTRSGRAIAKQFAPRSGLGRKALAKHQCMASSDMQSDVLVHEIQAVLVTPEYFAPFGQFVEPIDDMKAFDGDDAQLQLDQGKPRFYIMRLPAKPSGLQFTQITHHKAVTQCLGSLTPAPWYMAVARPGLTDLSLEDISVFKVPFGTFIKMNAGTWHSGPHFDSHPEMDFYNLELADTNQVDHYNFDFDEQHQSAIKILPC
eukprot:jgi/Ulvmu1/11991/UM083_0001.1